MKNETAPSVAFQENLKKEKPLVPSPLIGEGYGGGDETMKRYSALSPLPLTPSHQGRGNFKTLTY
jgi:hypothetical protein